MRRALGVLLFVFLIVPAFAQKQSREPVSRQQVLVDVDASITFAAPFTDEGRAEPRIIIDEREYALVADTIQARETLEKLDKRTKKQKAYVSEVGIAAGFVRDRSVGGMGQALPVFHALHLEFEETKE